MNHKLIIISLQPPPSPQNLVPENAEENLEKAFSVAEEALGIPRLLDVEDFILDELDEKSIMTYLSAFNRMYSKVGNRGPPPTRGANRAPLPPSCTSYNPPQVPTEEELAVKVYSDRVNVDAKRILSWIKNNIDRLEKKVSLTVTVSQDIDHTITHWKTLYSTISPDLQDGPRDVRKVQNRSR